MINEFTQGPLTLHEMMKIVTLLENPADAAPVRKALRFYEIPQTLTPQEFKWGENGKLMEVMLHYANPQNPDELAWMLNYIKGKESLLEIGSSFGGTLKHMASVMPRGCQIVSVDAAIDSTPSFLNPVDSLKETCRQLGILGANVELFVGDSHSAQVVEAVSNFAPFDFGFIDGDHSYEGVKQDWENYGPMCKVVGFHDIAGPVEGCTRFWTELRDSGEYRTEEFIGTAARRFGIGIVFRDEGG